MHSTLTTGAGTVLVTGANGFVGQALCTGAIRRGLHVIGETRRACNLPAGVEQMIVGAIDGETDWTGALRGVDVVIHLAARVHVVKEIAADPLAEFLKVNLHGTANLARQAVRAGVKRLVYVSSIGVNGSLTDAGRPFTEADNPHPHNAYAASKWQAEQALQRVAQETGIEVVIVRPPLVYGPAARGKFPHLLAAIDKGIPLPLKSVKNMLSLVYMGNLVDALISCAIHPAAAGQTYLVCDGEDISTPDLVRQLAAAMGIPCRLFSCPPALLRLAGKLSGKSQQLERLLGSLQIDGDKIRRDLNWVPPYSLQQGLQATAEWYRTKHA